MTNAEGLGTGTHMSAYLSWQNAEHSRHYRSYNRQIIPHALRDALPGSIVEYNHWLEDNVESAAPRKVRRGEWCQRGWDGAQRVAQPRCHVRDCTATRWCRWAPFPRSRCFPFPFLLAIPVSFPGANLDGVSNGAFSASTVVTRKCLAPCARVGHGASRTCVGSTVAGSAQHALPFTTVVRSALLRGSFIAIATVRGAGFPERPPTLRRRKQPLYSSRSQPAPGACGPCRRRGWYAGQLLLTPSLTASGAAQHHRHA